MSALENWTEADRQLLGEVKRRVRKAALLEADMQALGLRDIDFGAGPERQPAKEVAIGNSVARDERRREAFLRFVPAARGIL